ncbi:hypothetical protein [Falsiroseomonas tokyonensis]|uniref:Uncharacterized protein n=1 Tax=Falsiroseomonas tokyonensis TaxID=430521 RepID=A0ABV7C2R2_9PROT|nr:hypothetical protein [Falsiroseomonas tokyonensis]MBU8540955.1 hypothetical protein [Falsiroseomonas tokyonensis]
MTSGYFSDNPGRVVVGQVGGSLCAPLAFAPARLFRFHLIAIAILTVAHLLVCWMRLEQGRDHLLGLAPRFSFLGEASIPAFFSAVMLLATAGVAALLSGLEEGRGRADRRIWLFIAGLLLFMAVDEATAIHELFDALGAQEPEDGMLFNTWVIPFGALALFCIAILLPFWWRLPGPAKWGLAAAAALFLASAIGLELLESRVMAEAGLEDAFARWDYILMVTLEEAGEMLAVAIALRTLLLHLASLRGTPAVVRVALA